MRFAFPRFRRSSAAAAWAARLASDRASPSDHARLRHWLAKEPRRGESYERAMQVMDEFSALAGDPHARRLLLGSRPDAARRRAKPRLAAWPAAAALAAAAACLLFVRIPIAPATPRPPVVLETARGAQKVATLSDGSILVLNTFSRVRVDFRGQDRRIWLDRGEIDVRVAKAPGRLFRVFVDDHEVRALGTRFNLRRDGHAVRVSLSEGRLALISGIEHAQADHEPALVLNPGFSAEFKSNGGLEVRRTDLQRDGAWRSGRIILDRDRLADAVAEFNRYNDLQLAIEPAVADYRVSGVFDLREPRAFSAAITATLPVRIAAADEARVQLASAGH